MFDSEEVPEPLPPVCDFSLRPPFACVLCGMPKPHIVPAPETVSVYMDVDGIWQRVQFNKVVYDRMKAALGPLFGANHGS